MDDLCPISTVPLHLPLVRGVRGPAKVLGEFRQEEQALEIKAGL